MTVAEPIPHPMRAPRLDTITASGTAYLQFGKQGPEAPVAI